MRSAICLFAVLFCGTLLFAQASFKVGQRVEVKYSAHWYKATILEIKGDSYKVHYDGYPSSDDGWVFFNQIRVYGKDSQGTSVACSYGPPPGTFTNASPASPALFKREVYDYYERTVNGTLTSPAKIGVSFLSYDAGTGYKNTVSVKPGVGAVRKHDGAPANTMIYPVRIGYIVCKLYSNNETERVELYADFSFFKDRDGIWTCSKDN